MDFGTLAHDCAPQVAQSTLSAIVRRESEFRPLAIGINGKARLVRQPANKAEAVATAKWLIDKGYNVDLGVGQVNVANLRKFNLSVEDAFDPCKNLAVSAKILQSNYRAATAEGRGEQDALLAAISAYNTGSFSKGFSNGYVHGVVRNAGFELAIPRAAKHANATARKKGAASSAAGKITTSNREQLEGPQPGERLSTVESVMVY